MKLLYSGSLSVLLVGAASVGAAHGAARPVAGSGTGTYGVTMLQPRNGAMVTGAFAMLGGAAGSSRAGVGAGVERITAALLVDGLKPGSTAMARIYAGACGADRQQRYSLPPLRTTMTGDATGNTTLSGAAVAMSGVHINIYGIPGSPMRSGSTGSGRSTSESGAGRTGTTASLVACGAIHRPGMVVQITPAVPRGRTSGFGFITQNQPVLGNRVKSGTEVIVYATGLERDAAEPNHIHAGPCGTFAPVQYPLLTLVSDAYGRAIAGTGLTDSISASGLSLHIHAANFSMLACGNIGGTGSTGTGAGQTGGTTTGTRTPTASRTATGTRTPLASRTATGMQTPLASRTATSGTGTMPTAKPTAKATKTP